MVELDWKSVMKITAQRLSCARLGRHPSGVGAGDHTRPDQGRRGPRRSGGEDRGQATGTVIREDGGRPKLRGERRIGKRRCQDI